jgi:small subunit ribosomal protein S1
MSYSNPHDLAASDDTAQQEDLSFAELLSSFERQHAESEGAEVGQGVIVSVGSENILIDIGRKTEGILPVSAWREQRADEPRIGASIAVSAGGRDSEGYYYLSLMQVARPRDWAGIERAFAEKRAIAGIVTELVKGGFRVDVGVLAFMPASRSGIREMSEMPSLVGQEIQCRITKLDVEKEDIVVDRRVVLEEEQAQKRQEAFAALQEGSIVTGKVRNVMDFGAFVDVGGVDGLLHVADISWNHVAKASDVIKPGDELTVKIVKIDAAARKISLGLKQLQDDPWTIASRTFHQGDKVSGTVSRLTDFGAFVELIPGVDGLIHLSEMTWDKRVRKPGDVVKKGDRVEVVVLQVNIGDKRIALGLKQAMGDPWETLAEKHPVGSTVEGPITSIAPFGVFVDLGDGVEGMIHISDITNEKRLEHPREMLSKGQTVRAAVLEIDREKRRLRLGMKQLEPTKLDHYIAEHKAGETVTGRVTEVQGDRVRVELGEGIVAACSIKQKQEAGGGATEMSTDVTALSAMLAKRWKQGAAPEASANTVREGQMRSFRIVNVNAEKRQIELELAD